MTADALAHAIALVLGLLCVALFFRSIIIAVFLDRPRHDVIARSAALLTWAAFSLFIPKRAPQERVDRGLLWYWPVAQFVIRLARAAAGRLSCRGIASRHHKSRHHKVHS